MSKAAEKQDTRWANYRSGITSLGRKLKAYAAGDATVSADAIASEMVAIFRAHGCCLDHAGVSYDGPMTMLVADALKAAEARKSLT